MRIPRIHRHVTPLRNATNAAYDESHCRESLSSAHFRVCVAAAAHHGQDGRKRLQPPRGVVLAIYGGTWRRRTGPHKGSRRRRVPLLAFHWHVLGESGAAAAILQGKKAVDRKKWAKGSEDLFLFDARYRWRHHPRGLQAQGYAKEKLELYEKDPSMRVTSSSSDLAGGPADLKGVYKVIPAPSGIVWPDGNKWTKKD
eukprot:scaffold1850_cov194-Pinguiococcus_pyrenoidosus.AAC.64